MNTIIELEETWTTESFRQDFEQANEILSYNQLPYTNSCFRNLKEQQADARDDYLTTLGINPEYTPSQEEMARIQSQQLDAVKSSINDFSKARAISNLDWREWYDYQLRGVLDGYLQSPPSMNPTPEATDELFQKQLSLSSSLEDARRILNSKKTDDIPAPVATITGAASNGWFWKPRGDVMFMIGDLEVEIPAWPESVKDDTAATWSQEMTTYQHYQPVNTYKGSGPRTVSCTFKLHRAMWDGNQDSGEFENLVAIMESACYPDYDTTEGSPPLCTLTVGGSVNITGVMTTFNCTYQGPIGPDNKYDEGLITVAIVEVSDRVLSFSSVSAGLGGFR